MCRGLQGAGSILPVSQQSASFVKKRTWHDQAARCCSQRVLARSCTEPVGLCVRCGCRKAAAGSGSAAAAKGGGWLLQAGGVLLVILAVAALVLRRQRQKYGSVATGKPRGSYALL